MNAPAVKQVESESAYEALENAVRRTARGEWFLSEFLRRNNALGTTDIMSAIKDLSTQLDAHTQATGFEVLMKEFRSMSETINITREQISSIPNLESGPNQINSATEELDAIVSATERATESILTAAENLQEIADDLRADGESESLCERIEAITTEIITACAFQDITGQRSSKVVSALQYLEERVNTMIEMWNLSGGESGDRQAEADGTEPGDPLLNGPQLEGQGVSQDEIDKLLSEF